MRNMVNGYLKIRRWEKKISKWIAKKTVGELVTIAFIAICLYVRFSFPEHSVEYRFLKEWSFEIFILLQAMSFIEYIVRKRSKSVKKAK